MTDALRVGVLGAARILDDALLTPAREVTGVEVAAIAARDRARAAAGSLTSATTRCGCSGTCSGR